MEFGKARDFALDLAQADDGGPDFVAAEFAVSYGRPQAVEVNARRSLGAVRVHWRVAGGAERSAPLQPYKGGERYGAPGAVYHCLRGEVGGFSAGGTVPPVAPPKVTPPELVVRGPVKVDRRGRAKVRVRCDGPCSGVVKLARGKRTFARVTYGRSGTVTLKLNAAGRRASKLTLKQLYRGSGRGARLVDTSTVRLRRA